MKPAADVEWMSRALRLARHGMNSTSPNPRVGCVLVQGGVAVGEGWHERAGEAHAEIHALRTAGGSARGATAYVTLEPCAHHGRTPPCADALIAAGVARVVVALRDPNPLVAGKGLAKLAAAGIAVECGLLAEEARELNIGFVSRMTRQRPWVRIKLAASLDGRTALRDGRSQWITGAAARRDGHAWRARACAILTGSGTVLADDPQLTVREVPTGRQPLRAIVDGALKTPTTARALGEGTLIYTASNDAARITALTDAGAVPIGLTLDGRHVDLAAMLADLAGRGINELHVEAGAGLAGALLTQGLADEIVLYLAPMLIGDSGRGLFALPPLAELAAAPRLELIDARMVGKDWRLVLRPLAQPHCPA